MIGYLGPVVTPIVIQLIAVLGLYVIVRSGRISVAQATFFGIGEYASGYLALHLPVPFAVAVAGGVVLSCVVGLLFATLAHALTHWFFAVASLSFAVVMTSVVSNIEALGGATGLYGFPVVTTLPIVVTVLIVVLALVILFDHSALGRRASCVRDDPELAASLGISATRVQIVAFGMGAAVAGVAGGLWAGYLGVARPDDLAFGQSLTLLVFLAVGGTRWWFGPVLGTLALGALPELLRFSSDLRFVLYGVLLAVVMVLRPSGLLPRVRLPASLRARIRILPAGGRVPPA